MKVLFIHVPRTGGSSIDRYLRKAVDYQNLADEGQPVLIHDKHWINAKHISIGSLMARGVFDRRWLNSRFKVAFVRNPWDRLVSTFFLLRRVRLRPRVSRKSNDSLCDFKTFVETVYSGRHVHPISHRNVHDWNRANPQVDWLRWGVDFVGRYENLREDWKRLCKITNTPYEPLPKENTTNHGHYTTYYDDRLCEMAAEVYREDIETFGYEFGK